MAIGRLRLGFVAGFVLVALPHLVVLESRLGHVSLGEKGAYNFWREHRWRVRPHPAVPLRVGGARERQPRDRRDDPARAGRDRRVPRPRAIRGRDAHLHHFVVLVFSSLPAALYPLFALLAIAGAVGLPWRGWAPVVGVIAVLRLVYAPFTVDRRFFVPAVPLALLLSARGWRAIRVALRVGRPGARASDRERARRGSQCSGSLGYDALQGARHRRRARASRGR